MIEVGNIVTLENDLEYLILEELTKDNKRYVYTVRVLEDETPTDEFVIYECIVAPGESENEEYLRNVEDRKLYDELIEEFRDIVADKVYNGELEDLDETLEEEVA